MENLPAGYKLLDTAAYQTTLVRTRLRGETQADVWAKIQPPYVKLGELKAEVDPATFLDNSFIAGANDYRTEEVKAGLLKWQKENAEIMLP